MGGGGGLFIGHSLIINELEGFFPQNLQFDFIMILSINPFRMAGKTSENGATFHAKGCSKEDSKSSDRAAVIIFHGQIFDQTVLHQVELIAC